MNLNGIIKNFFVKKTSKVLGGENVIVVTGSFGKTTTLEACKAVMMKKYDLVTTGQSRLDRGQSAQNTSGVTDVANVLSRFRPKTQKALLEFEIEGAGDIDNYLELVDPSLVIITNISSTHLDTFGRVEQVIGEEIKLLENIPENGLAVLNWDDLYLKKLGSQLKCKVVWFGMDKKHCHLWVENSRLENFQRRFELNSGVERIDVTSKFLGENFIYSALASAAIGLHFGVSLFTIKKGLERLENQKQKLEILEGLNDAWVVDDTYDISPASLEDALSLLSQLSGRRRVVVLGEMKNLGVYSEELHRKVAKRIYQDKIDLVLLGPGDCKFVGDELVRLGFSPERLEINISHSQMVNRVLTATRRGDIVLVSGAKGSKLEEVVQRITKTKQP